MLNQAWASIVKGWQCLVHPADEEGQGLVEYALLLLFVAIAVVVIVSLFGNAVGNLYSVTINSI